jgi:hypothetical protein
MVSKSGYQCAATAGSKRCVQASQMGAQGAQVEVNRRSSMPGPGKGDVCSRFGYQSRSRVGRLINMGVARRAERLWRGCRKLGRGL